MVPMKKVNTPNPLKDTLDKGIGKTFTSVPTINPENVRRF